MVRLLRVALGAVGVLIVAGSCVLTWVDVDIDVDTIANASEAAVDDVAGDDSDAAALVGDARDTLERVEGIIPDRLLEASLNGQNAYELAGIGFVLVGLALVAALAGAIWAIRGVRWLRWFGLVIAIINLFAIPMVVVVIVAGRAVLERVLPESWQVYSPTFDLTTAPFITSVGAALVVLSLIGRSPQRPQPTPSHHAPTVAPPTPPSWATSPAPGHPH